MTAVPSALPGRRRLALALVITVVVIVHALITQGVVRQMQDMQPDQALSIKRMNAELVADMALSAPPVAAPAPPPEPVTVAAPVAPRAASRPARATSKPKARQAAASTPEAPPSAPPATAAASEASEAPLAASAAAPAVADAAASAPAFEWPQATRVTFKVEGYVRGPIYGNAQVEWVRQDMRYQVHVDATVGPSFAPLGSQRWTSEGVITPEGLVPQRFESVNRLLIKTAKPKIVQFTEQEVTLPEGQVVPRMNGVQDPASHYIQLAYEFMLNPGRLVVGSTVEMPLAWTKRQAMLVYDIEARETLNTPLGPVETFRLKPRPMPDQKTDILAEIWIAPTLQYLPIRMLLRQGSQNYLDMRMDKVPQQAAASAASEVAVSPAPRRQPPPRIEAIPVPP